MIFDNCKKCCFFVVVAKPKKFGFNEIVYFTVIIWHVIEISKLEEVYIGKTIIVRFNNGNITLFGDKTNHKVCHDYLLIYFELFSYNI